MVFVIGAYIFLILTSISCVWAAMHYPHTRAGCVAGGCHTTPLHASYLGYVTIAVFMYL